MKPSSMIQKEGVQMHLFTASDVLQFAIRLEEDGGLFYRKAADRSEKVEVKKLFNLLAAEEEKHKKVFEGLLSKLPLYEPPEEDYPGEYFEYLHNYIDGKVFVIQDKKSALSESNDVTTALQHSIQRKMDCVHYYQELKPFVHVDDRKILDKVINEEQKHFVQMSEEIKRHQQ